MKDTITPILTALAIGAIIGWYSGKEYIVGELARSITGGIPLVIDDHVCKFRKIETIQPIGGDNE